MTVTLIESIDGLRGLDAGSLAQASPIEAFTAVCITLNILHKAHSTLKLSGLSKESDKGRAISGRYSF